MRVKSPEHLRDMVQWISQKAIENKIFSVGKNDSKSEKISNSKMCNFPHILWEHVSFDKCGKNNTGIICNISLRSFSTSLHKSQFDKQVLGIQL